MDYKKYLTDEILAHYLGLQTDKECGGILNFYNPDCTLERDEKDKQDERMKEQIKNAKKKRIEKDW